MCICTCLNDLYAMCFYNQSKQNSISEKDNLVVIIVSRYTVLFCAHTFEQADKYCSEAQHKHSQKHTNPNVQKYIYRTTYYILALVPLNSHTLVID